MHLHLDLNGDEQEEMLHAQIMDAIHILPHQGAQWTAASIVKHHHRKYGEWNACKYCVDNKLKFLADIHDRPAVEPGQQVYNEEQPDPVVTAIARTLGIPITNIQRLG